jgi:dCMP deaminase
LRPSWNEYFMLIAKLVSTRSTCNSRPTGAVLVKDRQILATGYNGSMPGADHCSDHGSDYCYRRTLMISDIDKYNFCRASHAEANAIAQAARHGVAIKEATLYVTLAPCYVCLKLLATAQVTTIFYETKYKSKNRNRDLFWEIEIKKNKIDCHQLIIPPELNSLILTLMKPISERRLESI